MVGWLISRPSRAGIRVRLRRSADGVSGCVVRWLGEEEAGEGGQVLAEALMALASLAGNTVVAAATADAWEAARGRFARLTHPR
jgi:hypothetical protein